MSRYAGDTRERMFGEDALWLHKRGTARAWQGRTAEAEADLKRALMLQGRKWVHGRTHLELGRLAVKKGDRAAARPELQAAITLCQSDNDPLPVDEARRLMKQ
jgi:Flp pilus assembly protein TadD